MRHPRKARTLGRIALCHVLLCIGGVRSFADPGKTPAANPFATNARFAVDSEAAPSSSKPELLHPRLSLCSVAGTIERDANPKHAVIKLTFYAFAFTQADQLAARRGDTEYLENRYHTVQTTNLKSPDYNGGGWTSVQLTVDEHFLLQQVFINVPGYSILLSSQDLKNFAQEYQLDGKKLRLKSKGLHRLDLSSARVASFTLSWDIDLATPIVPKATPGK